MILAIIFESVGFGEWFILLAVVLIVVGPKNLPSTARKLGQYYSKFRRAAEGFKRQLMDMDTELTRAAQDAQRAAEDAFRVEGDESTAKPLDITQPLKPQIDRAMAAAEAETIKAGEVPESQGKPAEG